MPGLLDVGCVRRALVQTTVPRSYLFVPGNRPERFEKALASGAHAVVVDLEDAVPQSEKNAARTAVAEWLSPAKPTLLRVNDATTEWFARDAELRNSQAMAGVLLPKCEAPEEIQMLTDLIPKALPILPIL
jgi:citrate lyase subunit beta / citryl-CoA lyase